MSDFLTAEANNYLHGLLPKRPAEMLAMEDHARRVGFPIIGPLAGHHCYQIARMIGARRIFELGSGFGYSTAWFAKAVVENGGGRVYHTVWNSDQSQQARSHLRALGYEDVVSFIVGEAVEALRQAPGPFDLIFNDINKEAYPASLPVMEEKLRKGGVLILDNGLWHGRVFGDGDPDASTEGVRQVTRILAEGQEWVTTLIPVRDGLIVAYKR